jgi:BMFP domain-containing protein YqiC
MTDIVERLRAEGLSVYLDAEAADEIERLRARIAELEARLVAVTDTLGASDAWRDGWQSMDKAQ